MKNKSTNESIGAMLGAACRPQAQEDRFKRHNNKLGPQDELMATHLIVRWPALRASDRAAAAIPDRAAALRAAHVSQLIKKAVPAKEDL